MKYRKKQQKVLFYLVMKFTEDEIIEESPRSVPRFIVLMNKNQSLYENLKNR